MKTICLVFAYVTTFVCCVFSHSTGFCDESSRVRLFGSEQLGRYVELFNDHMKDSRDVYKLYKMTDYSTEVQDGKAFVTIKLGDRNDEKVVFNVQGTNVMEVETVIYPTSKLYLKVGSVAFLWYHLCVLGAIDSNNEGEAQNYVNTAERELSFATGEARSMEVVKKVNNYTTDHYQIEKTYEATTGAMHFTISKFVEKKERSSGTVWLDQPQANPYNPYGLPSTATRDPYSNW